MEPLLYITAGAAVGFIISLTGVGGGSLMTPMLLAFGFPLPMAVGTDLLYGALTKTGSAVAHARRDKVDWPLVYWLAAGSLPASIGTVALLYFYFDRAQDYTGVLTSCLGIMLIATAVAVLMRERIRQTRLNLTAALHRRGITVLAGMLLGILVTLSSVGAGAVAVAFLLMFYPALSGRSVVGTDIAHAVPLTLTAGMGHLLLGNVNFALLGYLLLGSLPAIWLGARVSSTIPERVLQSLLATVLFGIGIRYVFFS